MAIWASDFPPEIMSRIKGRNNRSTERALRARLAAHGVRGWRMHAADLPGKPDFVFDANRLAIFVDGCFWHGCPRCRNIPASNRAFWEHKINGNRRRDRRNDRRLWADGWHVLHLWEHELKRPEFALRRLRRALRRP